VDEIKTKFKKRVAESSLQSSFLGIESNCKAINFPSFALGAGEAEEVKREI
jgi:hypothetical protein